MPFWKIFTKHWIVSLSKKIRIEPYFYQLKNSTVSGNVSFYLNDESKAIIVRIYKNTYSSSSDEMAVLSNNKALFWNDEYGDSFTTFKDIKRTPVKGVL